jgi:hypothetical protein
MRASPADEAFARKLHQEGIALSVVEAALLLGSLRRLLRPADRPPLSPVRSLAYFQSVIAELQQQPMPEGYLDYLRLKLRRAEAAPSTGVQKNTFSDDR